jgi:hypothetical protein
MSRPHCPTLLLLMLSFAAWAPPVSAASPEEGGFSFHAEVDLYLGIKAGAEYWFSDGWGLRGTAGICAISPLQASYTFVGIRRLLPPDSPVLLDLQFGLIQAILNLLEPSIDLDPAIDWVCAYWVPGVCISLGLRRPGGRAFAIRLGGGVIFGYDMGRWQNVSFQPNVALEYGHRPLR